MGASSLALALHFGLGLVCARCALAQATMKEHPEVVMSAYDPAKIPIMSTLMREFAVCDSWFCSVPGTAAPFTLPPLSASPLSERRASSAPLPPPYATPLVESAPDVAR